MMKRLPFIFHRVMDNGRGGFLVYPTIRVLALGLAGGRAAR